MRPQPAAHTGAAHILNPVNGTLLALDPDIPPKRQRLWLRASANTGATHRWLINGKPVGKGPALPWMPWPGKHRIALQNAQGQTLDEVQIEVRGAAAKLQGHAAAKRQQRPGPPR